MSRPWSEEGIRQWVVAGYGGLLFVVSVGTFTIGRPLHLATYLEGAIPGAISLGVVLLGWSLVRDDFPTESITTVWRWSVGGGLVTTALVVWILLLQAIFGSGLGRLSFITTGSIAFGSAVGAIMGVHEERLRNRTEQLADHHNRLDSFASIVAHDLRNPLTVAQGHLDVALDGDDEQLRRVEGALSRMEQILDEVLVVASDRPAASSFETLSLDEVTTMAWDCVETHEVSLDVATNQSIEADEYRLRVLLEKLFRNAVDHGYTTPRSRRAAVDGDGAQTDGSGLTITVGDLETGFYVADDGVGIEPSLRERVFEGGYTTSDDHHGLGLSIVRTIADAHGWSHRLTESEAGGVRVEFTDVYE